ncbi:MAG: hypothetical protein ABSF64_03900 [Bryobacteraceae bacterium]|jgi:hypothetical protein
MNNDSHDDMMKPEYDFSRAERGKHYAGPDAVFHVPVYLEQEVQAFLIERAASKGVPLDRLVNDLLKGDIEAFRALG